MLFLSFLLIFFKAVFAHVVQIFSKHKHNNQDCSQRPRLFLKTDPLSVVRRVGGTEPSRAANRTDCQGGREGNGRWGGGDCCSPKGSGEPAGKGGAWGLWPPNLPPDVPVQLLQFRVHEKGRLLGEGRASDGRQGEGEAKRVGEGRAVRTVKGLGNAPQSVGPEITWQGATMGPTCLCKSPSARRLRLRSGLLMLRVNLCRLEREREKKKRRIQ